MHSGSEGLVSESELAELTRLFCQFEGPDSPVSTEVKQAQQRFHRIVEKIYWARVHEAYKDQITSTAFLSMVRRECRLRVDKDLGTSHI